ncbi:FkbM family methyltransferase [Imperialibacter sp.]|uniref:FkbM family methyltransferase n=1 Tax=Imperialibacter sp. TaxID=2038411 RepID=UPI0032ECB352
MSFKEKLVSKVATFLKVNLQKLAYEGKGITNETNPEKNGEMKALAGLFSDSSSTSIFFDIGANVGDFSKLVCQRFPSATVFSFEPNPNSFSSLQAEMASHEKCETINAGLGSEGGKQLLHYYKSSKKSSHASVFRDVLTDIHGRKDTEYVEVQITTIDDFCAEREIGRIDFLKIDTEGSELAVLQGATKLLSSGVIHAIQFEFNEMNIVSRVFLKDFYDLLKGYKFFRISSKGLLPLGSYNTRNEIFRMQNILAVKE